MERMKKKNIQITGVQKVGTFVAYIHTTSAQDIYGMLVKCVNIVKFNINLLELTPLF